MINCKDLFTTFQNSYKQILEPLEDNLSAETKSKSPARAANALVYATGGYHSDPKKILSESLFQTDSDDAVLVSNIDFFSLCEHHLLPFYGKCHISYLPKKHVIGFSRMTKLVDILSRRLQIQERLTSEISSHLFEQLDPYGVAVYVEAYHLCMRIGEMPKVDATIVTTSFKGAYKEQAFLRQEFLQIISQQ